MTDIDFYSKYLLFEKSTGTFFWKERKLIDFNAKSKDLNRICKSWNNKFKGKAAGSINKGLGYNQIRIKGKLIYAHRLAHLFVTGEWPKEQIDHENGNKLDNYNDNLRDVSLIENRKNMSMSSKNSSGHTGVSFNKKLNKWRAYITINYKQEHLGIFNTIEEAILVRKQAENKYGFHKNHGRSK